LNQAVTLLAEGISVDAVDQAMRAFGFKGGPFEIVDVIGVDTCMHAGKVMWDYGADCVTLSPIIPKLVKTGRLGCKSGRGFYRYAEPSGPAQVDEELSALIAPYLSAERVQGGEKSDPKRAGMIVESILSVAVLEAARLIEGGHVANFRDIEVAIINGLSFPAHHGGLLFWADRFGIGKINRRLERMASGDPRKQPNEWLRKMERFKEKFYSS
jgi:3-hydroxyacyl-CoA dehydrogenase/enoyl-CoA hydratase/3-hydroxybutyryl-CoA epimerase/3-hydroxyacyl-CoA dehydrogenase/enoyl-CoA hydratase/3-hydroxybutyryl-CoA epimerase/enoyl-CoA isomerase